MTDLTWSQQFGKATDGAMKGITQIGNHLVDIAALGVERDIVEKIDKWVDDTYYDGSMHYAMKTFTRGLDYYWGYQILNGVPPKA